jgi:O-antigen ligase
LVFVAVSCLAFVVGQLPWFNFTRNAPLDAKLGGLALFILAALTFLLAANQVRELVWLQRLTFAFLAIGGLYIFGRMVPGLGQVTRYLFQSQAIGGVFWACLPALALGQALFNRDLKLGWRVVLIVLVLAAVYVAYVQNYRWKSGWIPALTGVAVVVWLRNPRVGLAMALAALPLVWRIVPDLLASDTYSISTRFDAWVILAEIVKVSPIIGMGFGNYYWYTPLFGIRGFDVSFNSHNNYVDIIAQTGVVGLVCLSWFFWETGRLGRELRNRVPTGFPRGYVYGVLGAFVATLVAGMLGDWMLPFVYNVGLAGFRTGVLIWFFLGGLVLLENLYPADQEKAV